MTFQVLNQRRAAAEVSFHIGISRGGYCGLPGWRLCLVVFGAVLKSAGVIVSIGGVMVCTTDG
jgi:hypothetical protein